MDMATAITMFIANIGPFRHRMRQKS